MAIKLDRARQIQGWMSDKELAWLAERAKTHYRIVEVGSWKGRSTVALAENTPGIVLAVDTWLGSMEHSAELIGPEGQLFQQFTENTKGLPVFPMQLLSASAAKAFDAMSFRVFDMIFIDAAHDYESVKEDILLWKALLQPGGLLCGHDYGQWPDVEKAVTEVLGEVEIAVHSIWMKDNIQR